MLVWMVLLQTLQQTGNDMRKRALSVAWCGKFCTRGAPSVLQRKRESFIGGQLEARQFRAQNLSQSIGKV